MPTVSTVTPNRGLTIGEDCVTIVGTGFPTILSGGTLRVLFGGVEAKEAGAINDTTIIAITPDGVVGDVDVTVEVTDPGPVVTSDTLVNGFSYRRPDIQTNRSFANSQDSAVLLVTRQLIFELRRTVIENVHHDMHPEYVDAVSAAQGQEVQASAPSLKVIGPTIVEDRFYALNGNYDVETVAGSPGGAQFLAYTQPVTVRLDYQYVGVGRTKGEAFNLWRALTLFLDRYNYVTIPKDGSDPANGVISFELNPNREDRAQFQTTNRQGFHQFEGSLNVRGVHTVSRPQCESRSLDEDVKLTIEKIP